MEMKKSEFIFFARNAVNNQKSDDFKLLYHHLLKTFCRVDLDHDGLITFEEFDGLIEKAAVLPRVHGFAPSTETLYPNAAARKEARMKQFKAIDVLNRGRITFDEWLRYSVSHVDEKVKAIKPHPLEDATKQEFIAFIKKAVVKGSPEHSDLYFFLVRIFLEADRDMDGRINFLEFDNMIEQAAAMPRKHGLAPKSSEMYASDADRQAARRKQFATLDVDGDTNISLDEWVAYAVKHIIGKVAEL